MAVSGGCGYKTPCGYAVAVGVVGIGYGEGTYTSCLVVSATPVGFGVSDD